LSTAIPDTNDSGNYIFQLRTGVLFSNGASFTATHVYSSWQQRKENMSDPWSLINNVQILNEQTVQITPQDHIRSDHFLNRVAPGLIIVHPHSTAQQPIGTGPYQLTNWTNDMIEMMRNPHYTREKENFGIDHVRFQHYPSLNDALESADVILGLTITQTGALSLSAFETITNPVTYIYKLYGLENPELTFNIEPAYKSLRKAVDLRMYKRSDKIFFDPLGADKIWQDFTTKNGPVEFKIYEDTELTSPFIQSFESQLDAVGLNTDVDNLPFSGESGKFSATEIPLFTQTIIAADNTMDMEVIDPLFEDGAIITVARQDQIITLVRNDPLNPQRGEPWINPCDICVPTDDPPTSAGPTFIPIGTGPSGPSLPPTPQSCYWLYVGYGTSIWVCS
jgi:ABC-type transport system substrate-binding protein